MKLEATATAKTVEEAIRKGLDELGVTAEDADYEILEKPKKGFLGIGEAPAKVKVTCKATGEVKALGLVRSLIKNLGISAEATFEKNGNERKIVIKGEGTGVLIGHHGETLDSLQYLVNLSANRADEDEKKNPKITVDIGNYREKREETLRALARRMAAKVRKNNRSMTLEPMNPYERRIIHSEIQDIEGVSTYSVGADDNRKIVICPENEKSSGGAAE